MANSDKNIVITPNVGASADDPKIVFSGADSATGPQNITLKAYPTSNGTVSFEGSAGQLFSITNDLSGTIFSVNDVSGIPSIEVNADGTVKIAEYSGNVLIGTDTDNGTDKLQINGSISATTFTGAVTGNATTATTLATARTIGGVSFNGSANINLPGVNTAGNQNTSGTAAVSTAATITTSDTASAFKVPFANTTASTTGNYGLLQDSTGTFTYNPNTNTLVVGTVSAALSGNATTATTLQTARTINGVSFNGSADITVADDTKLPLSGGTLTGQLISTRANSTTTGTGQIYLNGATGNRIDFNQNGVAAPAFTTRSAGTKLVLYPNISGSLTDYALGIESNTLWYSVPNTSSQFKWYGGTSTAMTLSGAGVLTATTFSGALSGNATTATTLQTARTINGVSFNGSADITVPVPPRAVAASGTSGTLSPNSDTTDIFNAFGLTGAVTFNVPTGTPVDGQRLVLRLRDSGSDQGLTWTTTSGGYRVIGTTLPSTTTASKLLYVGCIYNSTDSFWDVVAVTTEA